MPNTVDTSKKLNIKDTLLLQLMLEDDDDYGAGNEEMPTGMKSYFFESCIKAIDYFIRNYKEVFGDD